MLQLDVFTAVLDCFVLFFDGVQQGRRQFILVQLGRESVFRKKTVAPLPSQDSPPLTYF